MPIKMTRIALWIAAACLASTASAATAALDAASAKAFVESLYSHYPSNPDTRSAFDPTGKNAGQVFDPGMVAAFREDRRLAHGEVGFVDSDPLCQCQDDTGMKATVGSVTATGPNAADVVVNLVYPNDPAIALTLHLVPVNGAWRIYDLSAGDVKSYRADLIKANKEAAAQHR
jgi:Protein of unknown function (DUF3828)